MKTCASIEYRSPVGAITVTESDGAIVRVAWGRCRKSEPTEILRETEVQLAAYFAGELHEFDLPLSPAGTPFDRSVWSAMQTIPFGETRTYGSIARSIGGIARSVGTACGRNPIPIVIPCHRVVGSNGYLGGYSGGSGVSTKEQLLQLEGVDIRRQSIGRRDQLSLF